MKWTELTEAYQHEEFSSPTMMIKQSDLLNKDYEDYFFYVMGTTRLIKNPWWPDHSLLQLLHKQNFSYTSSSMRLNIKPYWIYREENLDKSWHNVVIWDE